MQRAEAAFDEEAKQKPWVLNVDAMLQEFMSTPDRP